MDKSSQLNSSNNFSTDYGVKFVSDGRVPFFVAYSGINGEILSDDGATITCSYVDPYMIERTITCDQKQHPGVGGTWRTTASLALLKSRIESEPGLESLAGLDVEHGLTHKIPVDTFMCLWKSI